MRAACGLPAQYREEAFLNGGQALVKRLCDLGVSSVFCVPGESFLPVLDALRDVEDQITTISCRHESGAGFAAEAQGKLCGTAGAVFVTRGPGAFNVSLPVHVGSAGLHSDGGFRGTGRQR